MEVSPLSISDAENWTEDFSVTLNNQRQRVREFLSAQQERLRQAELELASQLQRIAAEMAHDRVETQRAKEDLAQRAEQLKFQSASIEQIKNELNARQAVWENLYRGVFEQQQAYAEQVKKQQEELALRRQEILDQQAAAVAAESRLQQDREALGAQRAELENQRTELHRSIIDQQQAFADQIKIQQNELMSRRQEIIDQQATLAVAKSRLHQDREALESQRTELEKHRAELQRRIIDRQEAFADHVKKQQDELTSLRQEILDQQAAVAVAESQLKQERKTIEADSLKLESQRTQLLALQDSLQILQSELEKRHQQLDDQITRTDVQRRRIARELKAQHAANLKELESRRLDLAKTADKDQSETQRELESLREECRILKSNPSLTENISREKKEVQQNESDQRRYESLVNELSELKNRNEELQQQLTQTVQRKEGSHDHISAGILNWEVEKERILATLEANYDDNSEEAQNKKLEIEQIIQKTDQIIAEKDREIGELQELLETQTKRIGGVAVGASAIGDILDNDAVIQEERKNLERLQKEWRDKLRQAEVEISLERATIARERSQLDDKIRTLERQGVNLAAAKDDKNKGQPIRGRWLARLGLKEEDKEPKSDP
jgi:hypothetical protein